MSMNIDTSANLSANISSTAPPPSTYLATVLRRHRLLIGIVLLHLLGAVVLSSANVRPFHSGALPILIGVMKTLVWVYGVNFLLWRIGYGMFVERPRELLRWLISDIREKLCDWDLLADTAIVFLSVMIMASTYIYLKDMIPVLHPFALDPVLSQLDRTLHGGVDPWRLLWPVLGTPFVTTALNVAYHLWFFLLYIGVFAATFDRRDPTRRTVFLVAFCLVWIVGGNLIATGLSSAGPVYSQVLGFGDQYVAQMEGLKALNEISPVWSLKVQDILIQNYLADGPIRGISAMPSMHVANATLLALFGFTYARWLGWTMTVFAGIIMAASVHLGWHYAVDGYAGVLVALASWRVARILAARFS